MNRKLVNMNSTCYVAPCVLLKKAVVLVTQCPQVNATKLGKNRSESTLMP
jgi:hypothetical protein